MKRNIFSSINNRYKDSKGFTLIELLAVIVVLSIIMLIGVYAVLPQLEKSKKRALAIEANGLIESAEMYVTEAAINGNLIPTTGCYVTIEEFYKNGSTKIKPSKKDYPNVSSDAKYDGVYRGYIIISKSNASGDVADHYKYKVALQNKEYSIKEMDVVTKVSEKDVIPFGEGDNVAKVPTTIPACSDPTPTPAPTPAP